MADAGDVRRLARAAQVEEIDSDGFDFRVGGKGFVWSYPERTPGQRRVIRKPNIAVLFVGAMRPRSRPCCWASPAPSSPPLGYDGWPARRRCASRRWTSSA